MRIGKVGGGSGKTGRGVVKTPCGGGDVNMGGRGSCLVVVGHLERGMEGWGGSVRGKR